MYVVESEYLSEDESGNTGGSGEDGRSGEGSSSGGDGGLGGVAINVCQNYDSFDIQDLEL